MFKLEDTRKAGELFEGIKETLIWSCLEGCMGAVYVDNPDRPESAMALLGDFCFFAGKASRETVGFKPAECKNEFILMVPADETWAECIEDVYGERAKRVTRYAIKKEKHVWNLEQLKEAVRTLPAQYTMKMIDEELYGAIRSTDWAADLVSQFMDYGTYRDHGIGVAVLKDGELVAGASSYSFYSGGIEIEIDTRPDFRRKGLAYACGAKLILECEKRGLYPSWDAQNPWSVALAEKLGYHYDHDYVTYEIVGY